MTVVHVRLARGDGAWPFGSLTMTPTRRHELGTTLITEAAYNVALSGTALTDIDMPATGSDWCWTIQENLNQGGGVIRTVAVPGSGPVEYEDLVDIDPKTLSPAALPEAAWWAALGTLPSTAVVKGSLTFNVRDYGAVGDTQYIDQRVSAGTFGLAGATPTNATTFGKCFTDSGFTTAATDNTTVFQTTFDAMMAAGKFALASQVTLLGFRSLRQEMYIPAGAYYISNAAGLFSLLRSTPSGSQAGFRIRGDGMYNTVLYVRIPTAGATDYLFYDNNYFRQMEIQGITIVACTGTERFIYQASTGNASRWILTSVRAQDYLTFLTIGGTANADRWVFDHCNWNTVVAGACLFNNQANNQALAFGFYSPSITHMAGGNIFDIGAGGFIEIFGGSGEIFGLSTNGAAGRLLYMHGTSLPDQLTPGFVANGFKLEMHDDAGLFDVSNYQATFRDCNALPLSNTRIANGVKEHLVVRAAGAVQWVGGIVGDLKVGLSTDTTTDYPLGNNKAHLLVRDAWLKNEAFLSQVTCYTSATDGLTTVFTGTGTGAGVGIGRIQVEGCKGYGSNYGTSSHLHTAVNGSPFHTQSFIGRPPTVHRATHKRGNAQQFGLPDESQTAVIVIPLNCELLRIGIVKQSAQSGIGSNSRTWRVKDGNGTSLVDLTAIGTTTWVSAITSDIYRVVGSTNDQTLTLSCDAATPSSVGTGAEGYFFVDYI